MDLSNKHLKLLKKASRKPVRCPRDSQGKIVDFLSKNRLIDFTIENTDKGVYYLASTTEPGKAIVYEKLSVKRRSDIALVLSIIAIVISVLTAFTPFSDWSRAWIESVIRSLF